MAPTLAEMRVLVLAVRGGALGRCGVGGWWPIEEQPRSAGPGRLRRLRRPAKLFELRAWRKQRCSVGRRGRVLCWPSRTEHRREPVAKRRANAWATSHPPRSGPASNKAVSAKQSDDHFASMYLSTMPL